MQSFASQQLTPSIVCLGWTLLTCQPPPPPPQITTCSHLFYNWQNQTVSAELWLSITSTTSLQWLVFLQLTSQDVSGELSVFIPPPPTPTPILLHATIFFNNQHHQTVTHLVLCCWLLVSPSICPCSTSGEFSLPTLSKETAVPLCFLWQLTPSNCTKNSVLSRRLASFSPSRLSESKESISSGTQTTGIHPSHRPPVINWNKSVTGNWAATICFERHNWSRYFI